MEQEYNDRVEAYVKGMLNPAEKEQFNSDLENDPKLKELYEEYSLAMDAIDLQVEKDLRRQFSEWKEEQEEETVKTRRIAISAFYKYAASLAVILGIAYTFFINDGQTSRREIALAAYELPPNPGSEMGKGDKLWSQGRTSFENGHYLAAAQLWSKITEPTPEQQYYTAHAYFNADSLELAANLFEQVSRTTNIYTSNANWDLLLSYLALEDSLSFRNQYEIVMSKGGKERRQDAKKLLKKSNY